MQILTITASLILLSFACNGSGGLGAACESGANCDDLLQCVRQVCIAHCERATQCGDGYACGLDGLCIESRGALGSSCASETACRAGLSCQLDKSDANNDGTLLASCLEDHPGHAVGGTCTNDDQCRNGTCALGHCVDLCSGDRDCPPTMICGSMPRVEVGSDTGFHGCLPAQGLLTWDIPVPAPSADVLVPVPDHARALSLTMSVDDDSQLVGATLLTSPSRQAIFDRRIDYYENPIRHRPQPSVAVLQIPSSAGVSLDSKRGKAAYRLTLSSLRPNGNTGSATPRLRATVRLGSASHLALHFYFLDLAEHPCLGTEPLNATSAVESLTTLFLSPLRGLFAAPGITIDVPTYEDLPNNPGLDNVTSENARALLALGRYSTGINVFFVRSLSPSGVMAYAPSPGTAGIKGTAASGVIISVESLCYNSWAQFARITAYELSRYMGLFPNRDIGGHPDPIGDSGIGPDNLMFFSTAIDDTKLSPGQQSILLSSPVLEAPQ
jgi:hypothetical protein